MDCLHKVLFRHEDPFMRSADKAATLLVRRRLLCNSGVMMGCFICPGGIAHAHVAAGRDLRWSDGIGLYVSLFENPYIL